MKNKTSIVITTLMVASLFIAVGIFANRMISNQLQDNLSNEYGLHAQTLGRSVADTLEGRVNKIQSTLEALSLNENIQNLNPDVCNAQLKGHLQTLDLGVGNLGRVNNDGIFYCSVNEALLGTSASRLGTYVQELFDDPEHHPVLSPRITVPNVTGGVTAMHVPVFDRSGVFVGSLGGAIYFEDLSVQYLDDISLGDGGTVFVQDNDGTILYTRFEELEGKNYFSQEIQDAGGDGLNTAIRGAHEGKESIGRYTFKGVERIAAVTPIEVAEGRIWVVGVTIPVDEVKNIFARSGVSSAFNSVTGLFIFSVLALAGIMIFNKFKSYKLQESKDHFVSIASHELRTPATAVKNYLGLMKEGYSGELTEEQTLYVNQAYEANEEQLATINDLLQVARGDSGKLKLNYEEIKLNEVVQSVIDEQMMTIGDRKQKITFDSAKDAVLEADPQLLRLVVQNLISNASKYTNEGGEVKVTIEQNERIVRLAVKDTGVGISDADINKLFKKFSRIDNPLSSVVGGTGLGLYMSKQLVELHHGHLTVDSKLTKGSTFLVELPKKGIYGKNTPR